MKIKKIISLLLLLIIIGCQSTTPAEPESTTPVISIKLPMGYIPDPQYAPFYVSAERGYFADAGFDVEFDYSFETDGVALTAAGETAFAVVSGEQVILARAQGLPVVYVMEWFQKFPIAIVSKADAGIETPADLVGRHVGLPGFWGASFVGYNGLLSAEGISAETIPADDIGFTQFEAVLSDQVEAAIVYSNNEPVRLQAEGIDLNIINVSDYIDLVANGIITNETMIAEHPEQVEAFVGALLRGLADTIADPQAAYDISKVYVEGLEDDRLGVLEASIALWQAEPLGTTDSASWQTTHDVLLDMGMLDAPLADLDAAYSNQFIGK